MGVGADALKILAFVAAAGEERQALRRGTKRSAFLTPEVLGLALVATVGLAGSSYWIGSQSVRGPGGLDARADPAPPPTDLRQMRLGETRETALQDVPAEFAEPQPIFAPAVPPAVERAPEQTKEVKVGPQPKSARAAVVPDKAGAGTASIADERPAEAVQTWPVQVVEGAAGRLVRIGKFRTVREAEQEWGAVLQQYPGMQRLSVLPIPIKSLRDGQVYYRLQIGTTSRAHSEVLCERAKTLHQSCSIIGSGESPLDTAT